MIYVQIIRILKSPGPISAPKTIKNFKFWSKKCQFCSKLNQNQPAYRPNNQPINRPTNQLINGLPLSMHHNQIQFFNKICPIQECLHGISTQELVLISNYSIHYSSIVPQKTLLILIKYTTYYILYHVLYIIYYVQYIYYFIYYSLYITLSIYTTHYILYIIYYTLSFIDDIYLILYTIYYVLYNSYYM